MHPAKVLLNVLNQLGCALVTHVLSFKALYNNVGACPFSRLVNTFFLGGLWDCTPNALIRCKTLEVLD